MISYSRDLKQDIPASAVKIIGLGGAGANMLERIALDSIEGAELLALNTDIRTLNACLAKEKIQLGVNLTKGLGTGGDPELGQQAMLEAEKNVREALKGQQIVFLCTGLGGGTGSGAAPIVARIAREEGAFVVVFATMPFFFEGRRRREQADTALNQLAVLSNALVTFDNNRMGELVLAKQGIHEAFAAADKMISESIKAVIRLVVRPGLINVGLDDLMSALRTTRSRCLFGSGIADGKDRASKALRNALASPLLDQGSLLKDAQTVLVHLSGGESLTLFEIELLMQNLQKHVPEKAHVLFGAAIDPGMGDNLSITLISALPEDVLTGGTRDSISPISRDSDTSSEIENPFSKIDKPLAATGSSTIDTDSIPELEAQPTDEKEQEDPTPTPSPADATVPSTDDVKDNEDILTEARNPDDDENESTANQEKKEERPFAEPEIIRLEEPKTSIKTPEPFTSGDELDIQNSKFLAQLPGKNAPDEEDLWNDEPDGESRNDSDTVAEESRNEAALEKVEPENESPSLKIESKPPSGQQSELLFDNSPRGRFEGENPNVFDGEDLDLPPFLRKKKS
ncbi:cell division protein FtsZ [Luteolibacter algae]|uniref:Cell division protein FtsZ n=1 Tax=Luteolibacter algae TaxID=454151 RepID=A0ABW5DA58_9BACT